MRRELTEAKVARRNALKILDTLRSRGASGRKNQL